MTGMTLWQRWLRQPQRVWLRRAIFQMHLWLGLGIGLYIAVLSLTGSILVYRTELDRFFATPRPRYDEHARRLSEDELRAAAERAYPGWTVTRVGARVTRRNPTIEIWLERGGDRRERLFNPYTGEDLGDAVTRGELFVIWLARLHDELLLDRPGRYWNGIGSALVTVVVVTGFVVWWPGLTRWTRSLVVDPRAGWRRITWDLHSALGIWLFPFMLMWGLSGVYLGIPEPFSRLVDAISDPEAIPGERPGDIVLLWLTRLHFGRWRNAPLLKALWAAIGVVPAIMFVTGAVMWWNRVVKRRAARPDATGRSGRAEVRRVTSESSR